MLIWSVIFSCTLFAQSLQIVTPKKSVSFSLIELKAKLKTFPLRIDDPVYKKIKKYDAFSFPEVLRLAGIEDSDGGDELVFTAVDGYSPNMSFATMKKHAAYLAYQETGSPGKFGLIEQGKAKISPWPFYVVWEEGAKIDKEVPWPYQLVKVEVVDWKLKYPLVVPKAASASSAEMRGFTLFKAECIRCHSINLEGGELGPELNAPQNVTEYWKPDVLRAFVQNSSAFRFKSKMPEFPQLTAKQLDDLFTYLKYMKDYKVKSP